MTRPGQANRAPLLLLGGLLLIVGGAVAIYRFWPSADGPANPVNPGTANPGPGESGGIPGVSQPVADNGPPVAPAKQVKPGETVQVPFIFWGGDVADLRRQRRSGNDQGLPSRPPGPQRQADAGRRFRWASEGLSG